MVEDVEEFRPERERPRKLALINVDLQNAFVEGTPVSAPDGPAVTARVNKLAAACRSAGVLVIHTARHRRSQGTEWRSACDPGAIPSRRGPLSRPPNLPLSY